MAENKINDWEDVDISDWEDIDSAQPSNIQETQDQQISEAPGKIESFGRGVEQGLTFGFGDELNAAIEAATTDKPYKQAVEESRQKFKAAELENPWTTTAGNITGAIIPAGLLSKIVGGTAAAVGAASKTPQAIAKLANLVSQGAKAEGGIKALTAAGAVEGTLGGAALGAGSAESVEDIPSRAKEEAITGTGFGAAGGAILGAGKRILQSVAKSDIGKDIIKNWKRGDEGVNFLNQEQGEAVRNVTGDVIHNTSDTFDEAWKAVNKQKTENLAASQTPFSVDKYKLENLKQTLPGLDDLSAKNKLDILEKERLGIENQNKDLLEALSQNPLHNIVGDKPGLLNKVSRLQKYQTAYENSFKEVKGLTKQAQSYVDKLAETRAKLVNLSKGGIDSNTLIRTEVENITNDIAKHPITNSKEGLELYRMFKSAAGKEREELLSGLDSNTIDLLYELDELEKAKGFYKTREQFSTDKGGHNKLIRSIDNEIKNVERSFKTEVNSEASKYAVNNLRAAEDDLVKSLKIHGVELNPEQLNALKSDRDYIRQLELYNELKGASLKNAKEISIQNSRLKSPEMRGFEFEMVDDQNKAKKFAAQIAELETEFGDLNNISPENAKLVWKKVRDMEKELAQGNISNIAEKAPKTAQMFGEFKKLIRDAMSTGEKAVPVVSDTGELLPSVRQQVVDDFGNVIETSDFAKANKVEQQIANILESITGKRMVGGESPKELLNQTKKIFQSAKDKSLIGESFDFRQALNEAEKIQDPAVKEQLINSLKDVKNHVELIEGYATGQNRMMYNPLSRFYTTAGASAAAATTRGFRAKAGKVINFVPSPNDLFKPGVAETISQKSPTLGKMLARLQDSNTSESKRRAYQNILLNNPIVRQVLTESNEQ